MKSGDVVTIGEATVPPKTYKVLRVYRHNLVFVYASLMDRDTGRTLTAPVDALVPFRVGIVKEKGKKNAPGRNHQAG